MARLESGEISTHDINGWRYNQTFRLLGLPFKPEEGWKAAEEEAFHDEAMTVNFAKLMNTQWRNDD